MFLYIKTNILRGYGIFKNDFAHPREPATDHWTTSDPLYTHTYTYTQTAHHTYTHNFRYKLIKRLDVFVYLNLL